MKTRTDFPRLLSNFLTDALPVVRNQSANTITSYRDTYILLLTYIQENRGIKAERIKVEDLTASVIIEFLNWLEKERGNSISTRNQRLAAVCSLFKFIQIQSPEYIFQCQQILGIPYKKTEKKLIGYLNEEITKKFLAAPDTTTKKGRRDQALLIMLYDSGARVQELADLKVKDIRLDAPTQVYLTGKGRKTRSIPLMDKAVVLIKQYMQENQLDSPRYQDQPLFFNCHGEKLTRQGITYIVKKYADYIGIVEFSPHRLRHTKAMHLTEANINPIFIRDFLGHTDLKVTEIYSKTSIKMKKAALGKLNNSAIPDKTGSEWTDDENLMEWLTSLGR